MALYVSGRAGATARLLKLGNAGPVITAMADSSLTAGSLALLAVCLALLLWFLLKNRWGAVFGCLAVVAMVQGLVVKRIYQPELALQRTMKPFMARVTQRVDSNSPLLFYRAFDYGALFYARRHIPPYAGNAGEIKRPFLLMWEEDFKRLAGNNKLEMLDTSEGRGPAGRHRLVLVQPQQDAPIVDPKGYSRFNADDD